MISEKARQILSEEMSEDREQEVIFLEAADLSYIFRLFRAGDHAGDPELRAIRWLDKVSALCQPARGELTTVLIRSRNEEAIMAAASGRAIEAREWPPEEQAVGHDPSGPVGRRTPLHGSDTGINLLPTNSNPQRHRNDSIHHPV